ncbi:helix-turn-helix domain-containing protein [Maritimibacter sp. DP1N21-5]|uniref:helix-turn-helix domain-containing protein n=1 Tax=Maritimibacter sp. DP1N21-5 TaxID=2836867 RepID=UPI001C438F19|nr:helix-turn-helix domain-containing protein [Maritimibacter sp. DP1N21-5]MBV7408187.1 helix-turn-helix domain-containing protein [Maritimibacter sp. DP1N21-5]
MADALTAEERYAIESYDGPVECVPVGVRGEDDRITWDKDKNRLVYVDPAIARRRVQASTQHLGRETHVPEHIRIRRAKVSHLVRKGLTAQEIVDELGEGVTLNMVYRDVAQLNLSISRKLSSFHFQPDPKVAVRRDRVRALCDGVRTVPEMAKALGLSRRIVHNDLKALGLTAPHGEPGRRTGTSPRILARRVEVAKLAAQGLTAKEIAGRLGVSEATVFKDASLTCVSFRAPAGAADG